MAQPQDDNKVERKLELLRLKEAEDAVQLLAQKYGIPALDLSRIPIEIDALKLVAEGTARAALLAVFQTAGKHLKIAVENPEKEETVAVLERLTKESYTYDLFLVSLHSLQHAWESYRLVPREHISEEGSIQVRNERVVELQKEIKGLPEISARMEKTFTGVASEILEVMLAGALAQDASDIHIEPQEEKVRLRFRLDGVLYDITFMPKKVYSLLLSRIKLISELKLNIHDRAQDGRFTIKTDRGNIEVRVSTLPGPFGENLVLRILNPKAISVSFEALGMQPWVTEAMARELKKPNGMILTTGPTGSGKTTTLYAFLKKIHTPEIKIITIEDPVEYHLEGITQTQVDKEKGYDFANGLRSIVRQDPDVILVGEIRDLETAETAMHASLTGHLVFSTLHTNSAAGTIPRLLDLGVKPAIIAPAINVALAQRLIRKLCPECHVPAKLDTKTHQALEKEIAGFPKTVPVPDQKHWAIFTPAEKKDCPACGGLGYKGRIGVYECIFIDESVEQLIMKQPSEFEIAREAVRQGQITMRQDGVLKVLAGITDLEELERIVGEE